jgi:tetratricopeptide (TPR) repeat protein
MISMTERNPMDYAGAYQILGRMHQLLPRIPLILNWPDKKLAEIYLRKSIEADPHDLSAFLFLGELLRDQGRHLEAAQLIFPALRQQPRSTDLLEDKRILWKLQQLGESLRLSDDERFSVSIEWSR